MNDKQLLELAAKAAGIKLVTWGKPLKFAIKESTPLQMWNPLTDDGDALRLAVKLEINLQQEVLSTDASISSINCGKWSGFDEIECQWAEEPLDNDPYAATRRAIVRAAAEIGKGMQQKSTQNLPEDNFYKTEAEAFYGAAEIGKTK